MKNDSFAWMVNNAYYSLTRFCVPIFFIIAAYISYKNITSSSWVDKIKRIAIPYLFWSIIYYLQSGGSIVDLITKVLTSNTSFHLWFLPPFLGFVLLLPAVKKIFSSVYDVKQFRYLFVLLFIFSIIIPSVIFFMNNFYGGYDFLYGLGNFGLTIPGLMLYAFSFPYMHKKVKPGRWLLIYTLIIALNLLLNILASKNQNSPNEFFYGYSSALVFVSSFIFFNAVMSIDFSFLPKWSASLIYKIGGCSFGMYLVHWLVYILLDRYGLVFHGRAIIHPIANSIIIFLISFILIYLARKFRSLRYLC